MLPHSMAKQLILISTLLHIHMYIVGGNRIHTIHTDCKGQARASCLDLSVLAAETSSYFDTNTNTTLIFQQGNHFLNSEFSVSGENLLLLSNNQTFESVNITCSDNTGLSFTNISQLTISGLNFVGCSATIGQVDQFTVGDSNFDGENVNSSALELNQTNINILGSSFTSYTVGTYQKYVQFLDEINHPYSLVYVLSDDARIGGALMVTNSNLTINDSFFANNSAQLGGAIFVGQGSSVNVNNCTFVGNSATNCTDDDRCIGGALFIDNACTVTAQNSTFENNTSGFSGGAIAVYRATFEGTENDFNYNQANNFGGSIFAHFSSSITSDTSTFTSNEAGFSGGVMYADYLSSISVKNGAFHYNNATMTMCATESTIGIAMDLHNTCFDTEAGFGGGVLYARFGSSIDVENSCFNGNIAENDGGVMYATSNSSITVDGSTFDGNFARYGGGVVYAYYYSSIAISNSQFSNSEAGNVGGVFHIFYGSTLFVESSTFDKNRARYIGGVLHAFYFSSVTIDNSSFCDNNASYFGGVLYANYICNITVYNSLFSNNSVHADGGAIFAYDNNTITVDGSCFEDNVAGGNGGVVYASHLCHIIFRNECTLFRNLAREGGGAVFTRDHVCFMDLGSKYLNNMAEINGGSICINDGDIRLDGSSFTGNNANKSGGALNTMGIDHWAIIEESIFSGNWATSGGAISMSITDHLNISDNIFKGNNATDGGALYLSKGNDLTSDHDSFINNSASEDGGVFYLQGENSLTIKNGNFNVNKAERDGGAFFSLMGTTLNITGGDCTFIGNQAQNGGVVCADYSIVEFHAQNLYMADNTANGSGGAIYLSRSNLTSFKIKNQANDSGAVYAADSNLQMSSWIEIRNNSASESGGGLYLTNKSTLKVNGSNMYITDNTANISGGGLHASNSSVVIDGLVHFTNNEAENGGGVSLEKNARLNGPSENKDTLNFLSNKATSHGGALYINDRSNPDFCSTSNDTATTECFFTSVFLNFSDNYARVSGADLFGGFLDRCTPNKEDDDLKGLTSLYNSSNIKSNDTISSLPVQVCFCMNGTPNCTHRPNSIPVETEKAFSVEIIALDQVQHGVSATFDCSLNSSSGLRQNQMIQHVHTNCTKLTFDLEQLTIPGVENLLLSVRGPCNLSGSSDRAVSIDVACSCPLGFSQNFNSKMCDCVCHEVLQPYNVECDFSTRSIIRNDNFWITYTEHNESGSGYVIYPNCPFDYCHPPRSNITVNLNNQNGSDTQCASNRAGILCGTCQPGLSVSLGSSRCLSCPSHWPWLVVTIIVVFILSGIALVILLLVLNLTVAVGTLNAIIFYANIVAANRSVVFQTSKISFATVIISWLNFDIGFDTCFYDGMDTYVKTWLQLAFPLYIIILVAVITRLSNFSDTFGHLIGKKDPVATLATLVLLSYTKFLQTIITAFSNAILVYPNGSEKYVWLPDATLEYFTSKHAILFFAAILILLVGLIYTILLFSWQWFLCCPTKRVKWIRNQKLSSFMEMYLISYTPQHRYWTGLLLFVRVSIYLVSAFNPSSDPRITLSSTIFIMSLLFLYIAMFGVRMYKYWLINAMETFTYFNLIALSIFTWYTTDPGGNQEAVTNISVGITFIQLLAVLLYHVLRYVNQRLYSRLEKSMVIVKLNKHLKEIKKKMCSCQGTQPNRDGTIQEANELLDMVDRPGNTIDSQVFSSSTVVISKSDYMIPQLSLDEKENLDSKPKELSQQSDKSQ